MGALTVLITVLILSLVVVRVAAVALILTGMSREAARFQARSAWTGTGFSSEETEEIMRHPVRRRIVSLLMLTRNAGFVAALSTLLISFVDTPVGSAWPRLVVLMGSLVALWLLARSTWFDHHMSRVIAWALKRWTDLDTRDYADLLHLVGEYAVAEAKVRRGGWMAGRTLDDLGLPDEGVLVLGVLRGRGHYIGAPRGDLCLNEGDTVLLYGRSPIIAGIDGRAAGPGGQLQHAAAVAEQRSVSRAEGSEAATEP